MSMQVNIEASWKEALKQEFEQPYFFQLVEFLKQEKKSGRVIYPLGPEIFNAFQRTPLQAVKVVILGQDPYHGEGQAHGLSFSVRKGVRIPPSLQNIYKELANDVGFQIPDHGDLSAWARQGVLLLNASLTVLANQPMSHSKIGWEVFTDAVIRTVSEQLTSCVFLLWGSFAQQKRSLIDTKKHLILEAPHPSPLSAHRGFFGCRHFSLSNAYLISKGRDAVDWQLEF